MKGNKTYNIEAKAKK